MTSGSANGRRRRILVVEDDAVIASAIARLPAGGGLRGRLRRRRAEGAAPDPLREPGRDRARPDAARHRRLAGDRVGAGGRRRGGGRRRQRAGVRARPRPRPAHGRRRLPLQAVRDARAGGPGRVCAAADVGRVPGTNGAIEVPGLVIDSELRRVFVDGEDAGLTVLEFRLLHAMAVGAGAGAHPRPAAPAGVGDAAHEARPVGRRLRPQAAGEARLPLGHAHVHPHAPGCGVPLRRRAEGRAGGSEQPPAAR